MKFNAKVFIESLNQLPISNYIKLRITDIHNTCFEAQKYSPDDWSDADWTERENFSDALDIMLGQEDEMKPAAKVQEVMKLLNLDHSKENIIIEVMDFACPEWEQMNPSIIAKVINGEIKYSDAVNTSINDSSDTMNTSSMEQRDDSYENLKKDLNNMSDEEKDSYQENMSTSYEFANKFMHSFEQYCDYLSSHDNIVTISQITIEAFIKFIVNSIRKNKTLDDAEILAQQFEDILLLNGSADTYKNVNVDNLIEDSTLKNKIIQKIASTVESNYNAKYKNVEDSLDDEFNNASQEAESPDLFLNSGKDSDELLQLAKKERMRADKQRAFATPRQEKELQQRRKEIKKAMDDINAEDSTESNNSALYDDGKSKSIHTDFASFISDMSKIITSIVNSYVSPDKYKSDKNEVVNLSPDLTYLLNPQDNIKKGTVGSGKNFLKSIKEKALAKHAAKAAGKEYTSVNKSDASSNVSKELNDTDMAFL